jgi:hypothetical protein
LSILTPREEFLAGTRTMAPVLVGVVPFGFVAGVATVAAGMSPIEGIALSVLSFSGIAQLIAAQLLAAGSPVIVIVAAAFVVSLRFLMYSAAMAPHVAHLTLRWRLLISYVLTDQCFAAAMRYYEQPGDRTQRHWNFMGAAATLYFSWQAAVARGSWPAPRARVMVARLRRGAVVHQPADPRGAHARRPRPRRSSRRRGAGGRGTAVPALARGRLDRRDRRGMVLELRREARR